jgi:hypothetical protein
MEGILMKSGVPMLLCLLCIIGFTRGASAGRMDWTHFYIANPLPAEGWGTCGTALADYDGDGDLDLAISRRTSETATWYEYVQADRWIPHTMGTSEHLGYGALGAAALDIDGDGWIDVAIHRVWFRNPGTLSGQPDTPWEKHAFDGGGHDVVGADINGDGREDIVADLGRAWYDSAQALQRHTIYTGHDFHGGVTPRGVGDLDGDGDSDVVVPGLWFENPGRGLGSWPSHPWPHRPIERASYGTSTRSWVVDLNGDGQADIVYSDCDTGSSHVYWVENKGKGRSWQCHPLPDPPTRPGDVEGTGSFHSLGVADFDLDGDLDIFAGEQEDPDTYMVADGKLPMKAEGLKERGVIWLSTGGRQPAFQAVVIHTDNPGWHDAALGDVDGDGDIDIVTKIWNKDGPTYHADFWRNETINAD